VDATIQGFPLDTPRGFLQSVFEFFDELVSRLAPDPRVAIITRITDPLLAVCSPDDLDTALDQTHALWLELLRTATSHPHAYKLTTYPTLATSRIHQTAARALSPSTENDQLTAETVAALDCALRLLRLYPTRRSQDGRVELPPDDILRATLAPPPLRRLLDGVGCLLALLREGARASREPSWRNEALLDEARFALGDFLADAPTPRTPDGIRRRHEVLTEAGFWFPEPWLVEAIDTTHADSQREQQALEDLRERLNSDDAALYFGDHRAVFERSFAARLRRRVEAMAGYLDGTVSLHDLATVLERSRADLLAEFDAAGFDRPVGAIRLRHEERASILARLRADRLDRKGEPIVDGDKVCRDVIASQRFEGIDARLHVAGRRRESA
jgi:hypothetical protein